MQVGGTFNLRLTISTKNQISQIWLTHPYTQCWLSYAVSVRQCLFHHQVSQGYSPVSKCFINDCIRHVNVRPRQASTILWWRHILSVQVYIFILGHHLGFGNCGELGWGKICWGSRHGKIGQGGEEGKYFKLPNLPAPIPPFHQPSTGQSSNYIPRCGIKTPGLSTNTTTKQNKQQQQINFINI